MSFGEQVVVNNEMSEYERKARENREKLRRLRMVLKHEISEYEHKNPANQEHLRQLCLRLFKDEMAAVESSKKQTEEELQAKRIEAMKRRDEKLKAMKEMMASPRRSKRLINNSGGGRKGLLMVKLGKNTDHSIDWSTYAEEEEEEEEAMIPMPKRRKSIKVSNSSQAVTLKPEEVTADHIKNIALSVSMKVYSSDGSTCHQCRQKTLDMKTVCRSGLCIGVRGQFCGVCLKNRYGENAEEALKDANWSCPPCRGLCNCSICRTREGKRPTGQLYTYAVASGYKSVHDFLNSAKNDKVDDD